MKNFIVLISIMLLLCGCIRTSIVRDTPIVMNSNIPVYKTNNGVYFMQRGIDEEPYSLLMYEDDKGNQEIIQKMPDQSGIIKSIYCCGNDLYYEYIDGQEKAHIFKYNIDTCENNELFSVESDHLSETYIYALNNDIYYYGDSVLWKYSHNSIEKEVSDSDGCIVDEDGIYYSINCSVYKKHFDGSTDKCIISKDDIFASEAALHKIQVTGGTVAIKNLILNDDKLYFGLSDANEGGINSSKDILVFDMDNGLINNVCEDISSYSSFVVYNDKIFTFGKDLKNGNYGLYEIDNNKYSELVKADHEYWGLYASDGYLYYYDINGIISELKMIKIS